MDVKGDFERAKSIAIKYVAYRDRSKNEVANHLVKKEFSDDIVLSMIEELTSLGYIDDDRFSVNWGSLRANKKQFGKIRVLKELIEKGVSPPVAEKAIAKIYLNIDEHLFARSCAEKKLASLQGRHSRQKYQTVAQFLDRQGFDADIIEQTLDRLIPQ